MFCENLNAKTDRKLKMPQLGRERSGLKNLVGVDNFGCP
jgi:hypothetical protein